MSIKDNYKIIIAGFIVGCLIYLLFISKAFAYVPYQGPYSPEVYRIANEIQTNTVRASYRPDMWVLANKLAGVCKK